jgi:DNA-binding NarL/FixJ family response regulator
MIPSTATSPANKSVTPSKAALEQNEVRLGASLGPISVAIAASTAMSGQLICDALKRHRRSFTTIGPAYSGKELLQMATALQPQVSVISSILQGDSMGGVKALRQLRLSNSGTRPILLFDSSEPDLVIDAFSAGARGLLSANNSFEVLCKCIRCVHAGQIWANNGQVESLLKVLEDIRPVRLVNARGASLLTRKEEQVVNMVAEGLRNREISKALGVSAHTVKNHLFHIYEKLGISNRVELILYFASKRYAHELLKDAN